MIKPAADIFYRHTERSYIPQFSLCLASFADFPIRTTSLELVYTSSRTYTHRPNTAVECISHSFQYNSRRQYILCPIKSHRRTTNKNYTFAKTGNTEARYWLGEDTGTSHLLSSFHFSKPRSHPVQETGAYIIFRRTCRVSISALTFRLTD